MPYEQKAASDGCFCHSESDRTISPTPGLVMTGHAPASEVAEQLQTALAGMGISADVHEGQGLALVSVWTGLVVWTDGLRYRWWTGRRSRTGRWLYAVHSALESDRAARRVAARYAELRSTSRDAA